MNRIFISIDYRVKTALNKSLPKASFPTIGMPASAIDGYVGIVAAVQGDPLSVLTDFMEPSQDFVQLNSFYLDRIMEDHLWLNVNQQS